MIKCKEKDVENMCKVPDTIKLRRDEDLFYG